MSSFIPTINCQSFYELMESRDASLRLFHSEDLKPGMDLPEEPIRYTIFDVRSPDDFAISTIANTEDTTGICVNINPEFIVPDMTGYDLEKLVCESTRDRIQKGLIRQRSTRDVDLIIFMDWGSTEADVSDRHALVALKTILTKKDPGMMPPKHVMLDGGFREWINQFPALTTNSNVTIPDDWGIGELVQSVEVPDYLVEAPARIPEVPKFPVYLTPSPCIEKKPRRHENVGKVLELLEEIEKLYQEQKKADTEVVKRFKVVVDRAKKGEFVELPFGYDIKEYETNSLHIKEEIKKGEEIMGRINQNVRWFYKDGKKRQELMKKIEVLKKQVARQKKIWEKLLLEFGGFQRPQSTHLSHHIRADSENIPPVSPSFPRRRAPSETNEPVPIPEPPMDSGETPMDVDEHPKNIDRALTNINKAPSLNFGVQMQAIRGKTNPGTTGLKNNRGYLCYANNVIQCLSHLSQTKNFFVSDLREIGGKITKMLSLFIKWLWSGEYKSFSIEFLRKKIAENYKEFDNKNQQDTQEFLGVLLDSLHGELKNSNELSIISETFDFQTRSNIKCTKCETSRNTNDANRYWFVPLPKDGIKDLKKSIDAMMEEDIEWECPGCGEGRAKKSQIFHSLPPVLVVVITRFTKEKKEGKIIIEKNGAPVNYPMELNLRAGEDGEERVMNYQLRGVSCHFGNEWKEGHYKSMCKHLENGRWYLFNDMTVEEIHDQHEVLRERKSVYMLFYSLDQ